MISVDEAQRTEQYKCSNSKDQSTVAFKQMFERWVSDTAIMSPPFEPQPIEERKRGTRL
jgi:hypothetical protein